MIDIFYAVFNRKPKRREDMRKKVFSVICTILMLSALAVFTGCGGSGGSSGSSSSSGATINGSGN
jgi:hypothetical protein